MKGAHHDRKRTDPSHLPELPHDLAAAGGGRRPADLGDDRRLRRGRGFPVRLSRKGAERSDVFYRLLRTFTEKGLDAQDAAEHRAGVIKRLLEDPEFRDVTTDYLREDGRGWDEKIRDEFT